MSIISKIIDSINFFKKKNKEVSLQDDKKDFSILKKYIKNTKKITVSSKTLLENLKNIAVNINKKNNAIDATDALVIQIKKLKNIAKEFENVFVSLNEAKSYFYENRFAKEFKILNKDYIVIEKIHLSLGSVKDDESLISKLLCIKKEKTIKRKKYIMKNQINRLEDKLNNLNEIIARIEKIYLDEL